MIFSMNAFRGYVASASVANESEQILFYKSTKYFTRPSTHLMDTSPRPTMKKPVKRDMKSNIKNLMKGNSIHYREKDSKKHNHRKSTCNRLRKTLFISFGGDRCPHCLKIFSTERFIPDLLTLVQAGSLFTDSNTMHYVFFSIIEISTSIFIVVYAWRWEE